MEIHNRTFPSNSLACSFVLFADSLIRSLLFLVFGGSLVFFRPFVLSYACVRTLVRCNRTVGTNSMLSCTSWHEVRKVNQRESERASELTRVEVRTFRVPSSVSASLAILCPLLFPRGALHNPDGV